MYIKNVEELRNAILEGVFGKEIEESYITGASHIYQTTKFLNSSNKYHNYYLLTRVDSYFGACSHTREELHHEIAASLSGTYVKDSLKSEILAIQISVMDAYLGIKFPHKNYCKEIFTVKSGSPIEKANERDRLISKIANIQKNQKVALIGVVDPLVFAIRERGGICLPCDLQLEKTSYGDVVEKDMEVVLKEADSIICTAMTLSNSSFNRILEVARNRNLPLTVYAQTGSSIIARFIGQGVTGLIAEPFPFTQFSGEKSEIFLYY